MSSSSRSYSPDIEVSFAEEEAMDTLGQPLSQPTSWLSSTLPGVAKPSLPLPPPPLTVPTPPAPPSAPTGTSELILARIPPPPVPLPAPPAAASQERPLPSSETPVPSMAVPQRPSSATPSAGPSRPPLPAPCVPPTPTVNVVPQAASSLPEPPPPAPLAIPAAGTAPTPVHPVLPPLPPPPPLRPQSSASTASATVVSALMPSPDPASFSFAVTSLAPAADAERPPPSVPTAPSAPHVLMLPTVLTPRPESAAPAAEPRRPQHLRRQRSELESAAGRPLFAPGNAAAPLSPSSDSSSGDRPFPTASDDDDEERVFVGPTRRIGDTAARENRRERRRGASTEATAERAAARRLRHRRHGGDAAVRGSEKAVRPAVVRLYEAEGLSGPSTMSSSSGSREKASLASFNTNGLTPDEAARRGKKGGCGGNVAATATERSLAGAADLAVDDAVPLQFTSPALRRRQQCQASTKNRGPSKAEATRLTYAALLGSADAARKHERLQWSGTAAGSDAGGSRAGAGGDGDASDVDGGYASDAGGVRSVHFRVTGAFREDEDCSSWRGRADRGRGGDSGDSVAERGAVVVLTVRAMSPLHADRGVLHPFVRAWVVSCGTGRSLLQPTAAVPCAVTHPFDLRAHRTRAPWWNAQVALRLSPEKLRTATHDAMLLLEVLDFGNESIDGFSLLRRGLYPICWGFLMLRDCVGRSNLAVASNVHVQLYRYPTRTPWYLSWLSAMLPRSWANRGALLQPDDVTLGSGHGPRAGIANEVPTIYTIFANANNRKIPYDGALVVTARQTSDAAFVPEVTDMLAYEEYLLSMLVSGGGSSAVPRSTRSVTPSVEDDAATALQQHGLRGAAVPASPWAPVTAPAENYDRMDGERSLLPHDLLQTTAVLGAVTCVAFAHSGSLVALGVCRHLEHLVELRNPLLPDMPIVATLLGHTGHLHRVAFQNEDAYLLSCSSDGTVRVWQPRSVNGTFTAEACAGPDSVQCVCALPHGFPVYTAIFHQDKVIAGGFSDHLLVWAYERAVHGEMPSLATTDDGTLRLTATFTPEFQATTRSDDETQADRAVLGELIARVDAAASAVADEGGSTMTLSLASNERSNRVWSVHANGAVVCWRATTETASRGGGGWQMSKRHTADCDGAVEVKVRRSFAIVTCGSSPLVFVFDATTCEQLRVVNTHLPHPTPIHLLADGEAFAAGVGDPGRLIAWECFDGGLCTASTGYARAPPPFAIARMAWAESQQLAVFVSRSPCSEGEMVRVVQGYAPPRAGMSAAAYQYWQQEQQYRLREMPAEMTLIAVAGTVRRRGTVILANDRHASEAVVRMYGGELAPKRKAAFLAERARAVRQRATERDTRNARLHTTTLSVEPSDFLATSAAVNIPYDATEKGARMNAIVNFWRGLVGQHRHADAAGGGPLGATSAAPPRTQRALRYTGDDDEEL